MPRVILTADLDGDRWKIAAPAGTVVTRDAGPYGRERAEIPGVLSRLSAWEVIASARSEVFGLRILGHSPVGTSAYVACVWPDDPHPDDPTPILIRE